jgi:hypothetical protein
MPKSKKANSSLKSWVAFVKKVQKEENISYPEAMKRASARKSEWKRGGSAMDTSSPMSSSMSSSSMGGPSMGEPSALPSASTLSNSAMLGGKRRRTKKNRKSKKSRKSRKSRRRKY